MEHYYEVRSRCVILLPHFRASPDASLEIFRFQIQSANINTASYSTLALEHRRPKQTVASRPVLPTVANGVQRSELVVHNHRPLC